MSQESDTKAADIKGFLESRISLIVDKSSTIRSSISQVLASLGQPKSNIIDANRFSDALELIDLKKPKIIFTEYHIDTRMGFEFFQRVNLQVCNEKERLFCMITGNTDDYVVAQAAEEDVDAYILKPFSKEVIDKYLQKCIQEKLVASPYHEGIEKAKFEIQKKNFGAAVNILNSVQKQFGNSALAFYYLGVSRQGLERYKEALQDFESGLAMHEGHYKCLVGKLETLEKLKRNDEAYEVVKFLANKYPINPDRLGTIIMLAVYTKNFIDVDKYFGFYTQLETKTEKVSRIVAAGLYASAKFMITQNNMAGAIGAFRRSVTASSRNVEYLSKIVETLLVCNEPKAALEFLHMYSMEEQVKSEWRITQFRTISMFESPDRIIQKGKSLINEGLIHIEIAKTVATLMMNLNRKNHAENFVYSIVNQLPDHRNELMAILEPGAKKVS